MTFMLSAPLGNLMMDAFSFSIDPKNAQRIFYVHINRLLVHIGAFDPVHIVLLLSAKFTTAWTRSIKAEVMVVPVPSRKAGLRARRWRRS
jgi:hypothetical protein